MALHEEAVAVVGDAQLLGQLRGALAGFDAHGQDHQVGADLHGLAQQGVHALDDVLTITVGVDLGHAAADVFRAVFLDGPAGELVIEFGWARMSM